MRTCEVNRKTAETDIQLSLNLDGTGKSSVDTGNVTKLATLVPNTAP